LKPALGRGGAKRGGRKTIGTVIVDDHKGAVKAFLESVVKESTQASKNAAVASPAIIAAMQKIAARLYQVDTAQ